MNKKDKNRINVKRQNFTESSDFCLTDFCLFLGETKLSFPYYHNIKTLDELLERDKQREKDGFKRKINIGKIIKPGKGKKNKVVIVPTTTEDKFYHDSRITEDSEDKKPGEGEVTGTAEGEEGDVIGEAPLSQEGEGGGTGAGSGNGEGHDVLSNAYDLGKILTEKFKLPNLKEKGKKKSLTKFIYDLTDSNRGSGQILNKKKTLKEIIKTNIALDRFDPENPFNTETLIINPRDFIYNVLSKERDMEAQALVFFVRDYSGSMYGKPTEYVCSLHLMIFSWLIYQYNERVETRFILHDTNAKEVKDFHTYYNSSVAGGTTIQSAFELVNKIVTEENLANDYNIYVFYGGDGDDWTPKIESFVEQFSKMFTYVSRIGISLITPTYSSGSETTFEKFLKENKILSKFPELIKLDSFSQDVNEERLIESIKKLTE
jgi:uncharacterized protein